ncbi:MAG: oligosaccharide flippase family protein [Christensenellaceae bacterium]|nr:oligosaccharide flippase family protein [Christensenellaceae bacterium]
MQKNSVFSSFIFKFAENFGNQAIAFIINIFLARLLDPSDYGILTILVIFINISRVFVQSGLNTALVQRKDVGEREYSSSFYFSLIVALVVYIVLFISAPTISNYFETPQLSAVLRVLALILFPGAFSVVQFAIVSREMKFKTLMLSSLLSTLISGIIGIAMAYLGFAYWALVAQQLSNQIILTLLLLYKLKWYPKVIFYFESLKNF